MDGRYVHGTPQQRASSIGTPVIDMFGLSALGSTSWSLGRSRDYAGSAVREVGSTNGDVDGTIGHGGRV